MAATSFFCFLLVVVFKCGSYVVVKFVGGDEFDFVWGVVSVG